MKSKVWIGVLAVLVVLAPRLIQAGYRGVIKSESASTAASAEPAAAAAPAVDGMRAFLWEASSPFVPTRAVEHCRELGYPVPDAEEALIYFEHRVAEQSRDLEARVAAANLTDDHKRRLRAKINQQWPNPSIGSSRQG
jgi:hypothetical protein